MGRREKDHPGKQEEKEREIRCTFASSGWQLCHLLLAPKAGHTPYLYP